MSFSMLSAFPGLVREYEVFKMRPLLNGGYGERYNKRIASGYLSWRRPREADIVGGQKTKNDRGTFWEQHDFETGKSVIEIFDYIEVKNVIYTFVEEDDFGLEGGFSKWVLQRVEGVTDRQVTNTKVDEAIRGDYE